MSKRTVEVFVAGCPCCDDAVKLVMGLAGDSYNVQVLDMQVDPIAQARAREIGVRRVPSVAVDGRLVECCVGGVEAEVLRALGVGNSL
jgi:hypothetical protein